MRTKAITFDTVRQIGLDLAGVEESTMYGAPALKLKGKLLTCIPSHKSAEPDSLAISIGFAEREDLLREAPETYYVKEHYINYPIVLVRMSRINVDQLHDLLNLSFRFVSAKNRRSRKS